MISALLGWPRRLAWPTDPGALRLILGMIVFVHHISSFSLGAYAVYVFFILSGYWLHTMWVERYSLTRQPYLTYMISRVWRLAPAMILITAITIPLLIALEVPAGKIFAEPTHLAFSTVFLLGYTRLDYLPVGTAWSLDVEMQFYLCLPLLSALLVRTHKWLVLVAAALISLVASLYIEALIVPRYAVFFVIGMVAAATRWRPPARVAFACGLGLPVILVLVTLSPWRDILWGGANPSQFHLTWGLPFNIALAILTAPFALYTVDQKSDATDRMFGDLSYIVYLAHWISMQWFFTFAGQSFGLRALVAATCLITVSLASLAIWRFYDKPINVMRARWVKAREAPEQAASGGESAAIRLEPAGP